MNDSSSRAVESSASTRGSMSSHKEEKIIPHSFKFLSMSGQTWAVMKVWIGCACGGLVCTSCTCVGILGGQNHLRLVKETV